MSNESNDTNNIDVLDEMYECALSTFDNPYDPFEQFDLWEMFDIEKGYKCNSLLARITETFDGMTQKEESEEIERAIDEIIKYDFTNTYIKVKRKVVNE